MGAIPSPSPPILFHTTLLFAVLQGVAAAVVSTAERLNAAALVLCGHSKGTMAEWLLGSVSDFAAHHAAVPVVVLHGSQFAEQTFTQHNSTA
jgi:hypothetical protein